MAEWKRRIVHAAGIGFPLLYVLDVLPWQWLQALLLLGVVVALGLEAVRLRSGLDWWIYEELTREYEQEKVAGYALYMISLASVALVFAPRIALPAMLVLAIADPVGGILASEDPTPTKGPVAIAGTFVVSLGIALLFLPAPAAVAVGAVTTVADGVLWRIGGYVIDDNLAIPVSAAVVAWIATSVLPT